MKPLGPFLRTAVYSLVGFGTELVFSALHDVKRRENVRIRTSPWMFLIYASITPLFEPLHDRIRHRFSAAQRATIYGVGFLAMEYTSGSVLRQVRGEAPWDYSYAKVHVHGLVRPGYFFLWAGAGLALEHLHDVLDASRP